MVRDEEASELFFRQGRKPPQGFVPCKVWWRSLILNSPPNICRRTSSTIC